MISSLGLLMWLVLFDVVIGALLSGDIIDAAHTCIFSALHVELNLSRCCLGITVTLQLSGCA